MSSLARPLESFRALVQRFGRPIDYFGQYPSKVVAAAADGSTLDVKPEDTRVPSHTAVPLYLGLPGAVAKVTPGAFVLLGWQGGDPRKPYVALWPGGETVTQLTLKATQVVLGDTGGEPAAKGTTLITWLSTHTHPYVNVAAPATTSPSALPTTGIAATNVQVK